MMTRTYFMLSLLVFCTKANAQYQYLKIDNGQVLYECVFDVDSATMEKIEGLLVENVPRVQGLSDFQKLPNIITGKFKNIYVDYRKYGGSWGSMPAFMNHPFFADVSILWKEGRYKVTVSNLLFKTAGLGDMSGTLIYANRSKDDFSKNKNIIKSGVALEKYLTDLFVFKLSTEEW